MATNIAALVDSAIADYVANASYEAVASRQQALDFIGACRRLIGLRPLMAGRSEMGNMTFESLSAEIESSRKWLAANPQSKPTYRLASFRDYKDRGSVNPQGFGTDT